MRKERYRLSTQDMQYALCIHAFSPSGPSPPLSVSRLQTSLCKQTFTLVSGILFVRLLLSTLLIVYPDTRYLHRPSLPITLYLPSLFTYCYKYVMSNVCFLCLSLLALLLRLRLLLLLLRLFMFVCLFVAFYITSTSTLRSSSRPTLLVFSMFLSIFVLPLSLLSYRIVSYTLYYLCPLSLSYLPSSF